jgi:hypothetical protein
MTVYKFLTYQANRLGTDDKSEDLEAASTIVLVAFLSLLTVMVLL